jgi:ATP-dependent Clp protease adaptor protein ClpS
MKESIKDSQQNVEEILSDSGNSNFLILHNDDYHTFDEVIDALIDICEHEAEQAVQCTYLVHYKGKADVKKGGYNTLKPMKTKLVERGLKATIE